MKLKYIITKSDSDNRLLIQEWGELDKGEMVLYCEVSYEQKPIMAAMRTGNDDLISILRTQQLYPPSICAGKIAEVVGELYGAKGRKKIELDFDDKELFIVEEENEESEEPAELDDPLDVTDEDEAEQLNNLLEDDTKLKSGERSLKVEDIETPRNLEEES